MRKLFYILVLIGFVGCDHKRSEPNIEIIQDMMLQPAVKAQHGEPRLPPEGTVPQGFEPYTITDFDVANKTLKNPLLTSKEVLLRGQKLFYTYCEVCHGPQGKGDGPVASKMLLPPPPLVSEKIVSWNDGGIFHLITKGRGLMSGYEAQLPKYEDRWAVVNFVRHLQKETPPNELNQKNK